MRGAGASPQFVLPKPGPVLRAVMGGLFAIWLVFALGMNWGGVSAAPFSALVMTSEGLATGEIWRLVTAPLLHSPRGIGHIVFALIGLYFLAPSLEERWGGTRFARFLLLSGVLAYATQFLVLLLLPAQVALKLAPGMQFGAMPVVEAVAIAWACSFSGRTVNLMFVLPVSSKGLIFFVVGFSLLSLIGGEMVASGYIALFSGMGFGWLLGGGTPSPLRRGYLKLRLARLEREAARDRKLRQGRAAGSGLQVIPGGKSSGSRNGSRGKKKGSNPNGSGNGTLH